MLICNDISRKILNGKNNFKIFINNDELYLTTFYFYCFKSTIEDARKQF
jgi:hypothetical protein